MDVSLLTCTRASGRRSVAVGACDRSIMRLMVSWIGKLCLD